MIEKLNRSSCLVKFCWFGVIAQAGRVEFTAVKSEGINAVFRLERSTEILELTYLGKYFARVNAN